MKLVFELLVGVFLAPPWLHFFFCCFIVAVWLSSSHVSVCDQLMDTKTLPQI